MNVTPEDNLVPHNHDDYQAALAAVRAAIAEFQNCSEKELRE